MWPVWVTVELRGSRGAVPGAPLLHWALWVSQEGGVAPQLVFVTPEPVMGHCWCLPAGGSPVGLVGGTGGAVASEDLAECEGGEGMCW